jgi:hypothetical protein
LLTVRRNIVIGVLPISSSRSIYEKERFCSGRSETARCDIDGKQGIAAPIEQTLAVVAPADLCACIDRPPPIIRAAIRDKRFDVNLPFCGFVALVRNPLTVRRELAADLS